MPRLRLTNASTLVALPQLGYKRSRRTVAANLLACTTSKHERIFGSMSLWRVAPISEAFRTLHADTEGLQRRRRRFATGKDRVTADQLTEAVELNERMEHASVLLVETIGILIAGFSWPSRDGGYRACVSHSGVTWDNWFWRNESCLLSGRLPFTNCALE